jgi:hypothetical protein
MALTAVQEGQITDLLAFFSGLMDVGSQASDVMAALGYGDVVVTDLPSAGTYNPSDVIYLAQNGQDVKTSITDLATYIAAAVSGGIPIGITDFDLYFVSQS